MKVEPILHAKSSLPSTFFLDRVRTLFQVPADLIYAQSCVALDEDVMLEIFQVLLKFLVASLEPLGAKSSGTQKMWVGLRLVQVLHYGFCVLALLRIRMCFHVPFGP